MVPFRQGFLTIDSKKAELKGTKFAFDHRKLTRLSDGFLLKPLKSVSKLKMYELSNNSIFPRIHLKKVFVAILTLTVISILYYLAKQSQTSSESLK